MAEKEPEPVVPTPGTSQGAAAPRRNDGKGRGLIIIVVGVVLLLIVLVYAPLLLALVEDNLYGTQRVENFCRSMGIHGELSAIYSFTRSLFGV